MIERINEKNEVEIICPSFSQKPPLYSLDPSVRNIDDRKMTKLIIRLTEVHKQPRFAL